MSTPANVEFPTGDVLTFTHDGYPDYMQEVLTRIVENAEERKVSFNDALRLELMEMTDGAYGPGLARRGEILPRAHYSYKVDEDGEIFVETEDEEWSKIEEHEMLQ